MTRNHGSQAGLQLAGAGRMGVALLVLIGFSTTVRADVVTDWNTIAISTVSADTLPARQSRDVAMVHAAMFDAMNAIRPYYTPAMVLITAKGYASREAAAAQAAHDVLLALFPAQQSDLDANLAASLAQIPDHDEHGHRPKYWGTVAGQVAATAVLDARQNDHAFDTVPFTALTGSAEYLFTPGCSSTNISAPGWGNVTPFTVSDPDYFPTAIRPALNDPEWLASLDEVRAYGASNSTMRTVEQTQIGLFYIEGSMTLVNRLARQLVAQEPEETNRAAASKQLLTHARLFAALNIAQADTYIRTWRVKYREHFWRPYTAINFLYPGTNWTPLRQTPCHPEFYAGHGTVTPAGITAIQNYRGSDNIDVTTTSTTLLGVSRHYTSLNQIIEDVNVARIYTGFHYRSTLVRSNTLGIAVANWVNDNMMTVLPESPFGPDDEDNVRQLSWGLGPGKLRPKQPRERGLVHFPTDTRQVPTNAVAMKSHRTCQLGERLKAGPRSVDTGLVFTTYRTYREGKGQPLGRRALHPQRHARARCDPHAAGVELVEVSKLLGHSELRHRGSLLASVAADRCESCAVDGRDSGTLGGQMGLRRVD